MTLTPERYADTERNKIINRTSTDLETIINGHVPEIHNLNNRVWDRLDQMALEIKAHGEDAEPARPTPFPASYEDLVFDAYGWSQTIIVDGKRPEWLRDDDWCGLVRDTSTPWQAAWMKADYLAIRVSRREPKRETVPCFIVSPARAPFPEINATIDLIDGKPDLSTLKIGENL